MRFDRFSDEKPEKIVEVVADGDHVCEITGEKEWTSEDGAREAVIVTFAPITGHSAFDKWFDPSSERDHKAAQQLLWALGLAGDADVGAGHFKGKRVTVTTKRATDKLGSPKMDPYTGLQKLWINGFTPATQVEAMREDPQRKVNAEKKRETIKVAGSDDIPF